MELVERETQLAALGEHLDAAAAGEGRLVLVGGEADWQAAGHGSPPSLFGRTFDFTPSPNRYGLPPFYSLHAWIWKPNPSGLLFAWNPRVSCEG